MRLNALFVFAGLMETYFAILLKKMSVKAVTAPGVNGDPVTNLVEEVTAAELGHVIIPHLHVGEPHV